MNQVKFLKVYRIVFRCGNTEKTRFVETAEDISYNIKRAVELLANQGVIADEILQIAELNQRKVYEISK